MSQLTINDSNKYFFKRDSYYIKAACFFISLCLLIACPIAACYIDCWDRIFIDLYQILTLPSPLVTDYYNPALQHSAFWWCLHLYVLKHRQPDRYQRFLGID